MVYFISDLHIGILNREQDKIREELFLTFLNKITADCEKLFILGDLFDYWFEYKTVIPKYFYRTINALGEFRKRGVEIEYLMGNHDFGHKTFFEQELDIRIYPDDIERVINGKKFYLSHGDGKSYNDGPYKAIKKIMRNPLSLQLFLKLHPDVGIKMASHSSKESRKYTDNKNFGEAEGMEDFAKEKIENGFDFVIMGHRHKAIEKEIGQGKYLNLGEWIKNPSFATFDGVELRLKNVNEFLKKS